MRLRILAAIAAVALVAGACGDDDDAATTTPPPPEPAPEQTLPGAQDATTFTGVDGVTSTITDTSRIVSLNGDITEVIYALGLGSQVVAVDVTTTYPAESEDVPRIGFHQFLAAEPILGFTPTVVLGDQLVAPQDSIDQLRGAGVPVVIIETQTTLAGVENKIMDVATALGVEDAGRELANRVNTEIAEAQALAEGVQDPARVAFLYSRGPQQIFLFGSGTVTEALIEGANAIDTISAEGLAEIVPLTPEALVSADPGVIILPESGVEALGGVVGILQIPGVSQTQAGRDQAFLIYDEGLFLNFGPRAGEALRMLITDLYPELGG